MLHREDVALNGNAVNITRSIIAAASAFAIKLRGAGRLADNLFEVVHLLHMHVQQLIALLVELSRFSHYHCNTIPKRGQFGVARIFDELLRV